MIYLTENNWYYWQYNNGPKFGRKKIGDKLTTTFTSFHGKVGTFKEELIKAASSTLDLYSKLNPTILFSGGVDSEITLRAFLKVGYKPNVSIIRFEKDYNIYDVSYAVTICNSLNIDFKIIDINIQKFFENEAERISELSQTDRPRALIHSKLIELTDGLPILGNGDLTIERTDTDYSKKGNWVINCTEHEISWNKFALAINKPAIAEWLKWTPGLVLSFINTEWCKKLVNDEFKGKLGTNSTKITGYRESFPDLINRKKQTGFEKLDFLINEFEIFLEEKNKGLHFRDFYSRPFEQLEAEIRRSS